MLPDIPDPNDVDIVGIVLFNGASAGLYAGGLELVVDKSLIESIGLVGY